MIKVSVMYQKGDDVTFDMDYYKTTHMGIVDRTMKPSSRAIDSGVDGPYIAVGNLFFDSMDAMKAGMGAAGEALSDIPNFTNAETAVQISEVVDG